MNNPFNFFGVVIGENFCSREDDIHNLKGYINNSANVVLFSKRRYGKTTLITELFKNHLDDDIFGVYIDIYGINDKYELIEKLSKQIVSYYKVTDLSQTLKNLKSLFNKISFSLTINQKTAMPEIKPEFIKQNFETLLDEILDGFENFLSKNNKKAVIAIDEFQDILNISDMNLEAVLRSKIQHHTHISYIFTGSKQHMLTSMFSDNKKPFYTLATNYELKAIKENDFYQYVQKRLSQKAVTLPKDTFSFVYKITNGETRIIQKIFYEVFEHYENQELLVEDINDILNILNLQNDSVYKLLCDNLTLNQIITLKIISKEESELFSQETSVKYNISTQSIKSALKSLLTKELVYKQDKNYTVYDKEFDFWLFQN